MTFGLTTIKVNNNEMTSKALIKFWAKQINEYARNQDMKIDPLPKLILLDENDQKNDIDDLLISTGGYFPQLKQIVLYIDNRHLKDIMRSYCHELIHHIQTLDNEDYVNRVFNQPKDLNDNPQLEEIEGDAYLRGNLLFRKFTEYFKRQQKEIK